MVFLNQWHLLHMHKLKLTEKEQPTVSFFFIKWLVALYHSSALVLMLYMYSLCARIFEKTYRYTYTIYIHCSCNVSTEVLYSRTLKMPCCNNILKILLLWQLLWKPRKSKSLYIKFLHHSNALACRQSCYSSLLTRLLNITSEYILMKYNKVILQ